MFATQGPPNIIDIDYCYCESKSKGWNCYLTLVLPFSVLFQRKSSLNPEAKEFVPGVKY